MGDYEKDLNWLLRLHQEMPSDDEIQDQVSDSESDSIENSQHNSESENSAEGSSSDEEVVSVEDNLYTGKDKVSKWRRYPEINNVQTRKQNIIVEPPGVKPDARVYKTPLECFFLFVDQTMTATITNYTNKKIEQELSKDPNNRHAYKTDETEIKALFGLLILAGSIRSGNQNLKDLWNENRLGIPIFHTTMSLKRFYFLLKCLRFDDIETRKERKQQDKLAAIRDLFDMFIINCQKHYSISEYCTIVTTT